jgi:hypothetical protein
MEVYIYDALRHLRSSACFPASRFTGKESDDLTNLKVEMLPSLDVKITARPVKPTVMYEKAGGAPISAKIRIDL